ncbi:transposase [Cellulosilyticum ruminicola]|uniref:transposase n=1 Tax=Cellulosilyticum ruminicola TaxID=425254 RepID=UPI0006D21CD6|nr:transposase [Cellulosilyticum ruminicola]
MPKYREILRLNNQGISSRSIAISCECSRYTVVKTLKCVAENGISWPLSPTMTDEMLTKCLFPKQPIQSLRKTPDYEYIHKKMAKNRVTLNLLCQEYCVACRLNHEISLMYTQFCKYYREFANKTKATMHIHRKPGERLEVDWTSQTTPITDSVTDVDIPAYIFVATLSSSQYAYVEAFLSQNQEYLCQIT